MAPASACPTPRKINALTPNPGTETRLWFSPPEAGRRVQPGHGRAARLRQRQQTSARVGLAAPVAGHFKPGDLALADRGFSTYALMALLWQRQVHSLFRLHHARPAGFPPRQTPGQIRPAAGLAQTATTGSDPALSPRPLAAPAAKLTVRMVRFTLAVPGYRTRSVTLITTLLDPGPLPGGGTGRALRAALAH